MATGRLYQAFVNAGFKTDADSLFSRTGKGRRQNLGYHIVQVDNMLTPKRTEREALSTSQDLLYSEGRNEQMKSVGVVNRFIEFKELLSEEERDSNLDSTIKKFINKYAPETTN